jgi:hypothetical protein
MIAEMLSRLLAAVSRPQLVNHELTDTPAVRALREATGCRAVVAVYDDEATPHADGATLEHELDVSLPENYRLDLTGRRAHGLVPTGETIRACAVPTADPPAVLLARNSLVGWGKKVRTFVIAHEFAHLLTRSDVDTGAGTVPDAGLAPGSDVASGASNVPATDAAEGIPSARRACPERIDRLLLDARTHGPRAVAGVRALLAARSEYDAGRAHARIHIALPETRRTAEGAMAEYHAAERRGKNGSGAFGREAVAVRNAAKYVPLPYDPPIDADARAALEGSSSGYLDWVAGRLATIDR